MILGFSTKFPKHKTLISDKPTFFVSRIVRGLANKTNISHWVLDNFLKLEYDSDQKELEKLHTIRKDSKNRWKAGRDIHFYINVRKTNQLQFAPVVKCVSTQDIWIKPFNKSVSVWQKDSLAADDSFKNGHWKKLTKEQITTLAKNDGFHNQAEFWAYFDSEFAGKIIHWTNFIY